jgi:hypothetical protein
VIMSIEQGRLLQVALPLPKRQQQETSAPVASMHEVSCMVNRNPLSFVGARPSRQLPLGKAHPAVLVAHKQSCQIQFQICACAV